MVITNPSGEAGGAPLAIWEAIANKRAWALPLAPQAIAHLFD